MKKRYMLIMVMLLAVPCPVLAGNAKNAQKFHVAATDAEKILDHILALDHTDKNLPQFIFKDSDRVKSHDVYFSFLFTQPLQDAWAKSYNSIPEEEGGGRYVDMDFITCGQESSEKYLYATIKDDGHEAYIDIAWPSDADRAPSSKYPYRMLKEEGVWKLDGVRCPDGFLFNTDFHYTK